MFEGHSGTVRRILGLETNWTKYFKVKPLYIFTQFYVCMCPNHIRAMLLKPVKKKVVVVIGLAKTPAAVRHQSVMSLPLAPCRCHPCGPQDAYRTLAGRKEFWSSPTTVFATRIMRIMRVYGPLGLSWCFLSNSREQNYPKCSKIIHVYNVILQNTRLYCYYRLLISLQVHVHPIPISRFSFQVQVKRLHPVGTWEASRDFVPHCCGISTSPRQDGIALLGALEEKIGQIVDTTVQGHPAVVWLVVSGHLQSLQSVDDTINPQSWRSKCCLLCAGICRSLLLLLMLLDSLVLCLSIFLNKKA